MQAQHDDPAVTLDDISHIQRQLFWRWLPAFASVGFKALGIWIVGSIALYFIAKYLRVEWAFAPVHTVAAVSMAAVTLLPFVLWVVRGMWLDFRISRKLKVMARRIRSGQVARASEVKL